MCKASKLKTKEELLSVAQEIAFAKALAANDKTLRNRALKKLKKWFTLKSQQESPASRFTEESLMRLWKGIFYCVWMADKPLVQEDVVESISNLIHCFSHVEDAQKFLICFFRSISQSWFTLDGHRMDKYLMLIRRFLRQIFEYMHNRDWDDDVVDVICEDLKSSFSAAPVGLNLHLAEIYLEELAKVGRGELQSKTVLKMLKPFGEVMSLSSDTRLIKYVVDFIFLQLIRQSDEGIKYGAKFEVWQQMGFPEGDIDVIQEADDDEEDSDEGELMDEDLPDMEETGSALDPRAGNVDVMLPPIDFDPVEIKNFFLEQCKRKETTTKARNSMGLLIKKYDKFIQGKYPLGIHKCEVPEYEDEEEIIDEKAEELLREDVEFAMEKKLLKNSKKGLASSTWEVTPIEEEKEINSNLVSNTGNWEVKKTLKRKTSNDESICANMKKIKISQNNSTVEPSGDGEKENLLGINDNPKEELNQPELKTKTVKRKKSKGKVKSKLTPAQVSSLVSYYNDELIKEVKRHKEMQKRIKKAKDEWGINNGEWDSDEEELIIPFKPGDSASKAAKKPETPSALKNVHSGAKRTPGSGKKVEFVLTKNTEQGDRDYILSVQKSPNIPYDAEKRPERGAIKPHPILSAVNPFYTAP